MVRLSRKDLVRMLAAQGSGAQSQKISQKAQQLWNNTGAAFRPVAQYTASQNLVNIIKFEEGYRRHNNNPNLAALYNDAVKNCTVGYGTLVHLGKCAFSPSDQREAPYLNGITLQHAEQLLRADMAVAERDVKALLKGANLTQHMYDAYVSLLYNIGRTRANPAWKVFTEAKNGNYNNAAKEFLDIDNAGGGKLAGLTLRRQRERDIFLYGKY